MRNPDYIIKIAADSVKHLRSIDVYRVLDNCSDEELQPTTEYIIQNRPDLFNEAIKCWEDIFAERAAA